MTYKGLLVKVFISVLVLIQFHIEIDGATILEEEENLNLIETKSDNTESFDYRHIGSIWSDKNNREDVRSSHANYMKRNMNLTVDPCENFYQYACGNWDQLIAIPPDESEFNIFVMLNNNLEKHLNEILSNRTGLLDDENDTNVENKAKNFFLSCLNSESQQEEGIEKILEITKFFGGWPVLDPNWKSENFDWLNLTVNLGLLGERIFLGISVGDDLNDANETVIYISNDVLSLINPDDYLLESKKDHLNAYRKYIRNILKDLGVDKQKAQEMVTEIIDFEIELAKIHEPSEPSDTNITDSVRYVSDLHRLYPDINWQQYLTNIFEKEINLTQPIGLNENYIRNLIDLILKTDKRIVANYMFWRWTDSFIEESDILFVEAATKLDVILTGQKRPQPIWEKCALVTNRIFEIPISTMFVRKYFNEIAKNDVAEVMNELKISFKEILENLDWIDDETKKSAKLKLDSIILNVGYPEYIKTPEYNNNKYRNLKIDKRKYFENFLNCSQFNAREMYKKLNTKVNKNEWSLAPTAVNAHYEHAKNRIIVPAAILQPPIYHREFPKSFKYAGLGALVGHEITHGFDDVGHTLDENATSNDWWSNSSKKGFEERTKCFIEQYSNLEFYGKKVDGNISKSENIADNGGLWQAFNSYKKWIEKHKDSDEIQYETLPELNLTNTQLFFLYYAQIWCGTILPEAIESRSKTEKHNFGQIRAIAALMNQEEFGKEFNCPIGSPMNPRTKCRLW